MNMIELDKFLEKIDWSQVSPKFLERAMQEYTVRLAERDAVLAEFPNEDFERMYYGVPVSFPRRKHAYKMAWDMLKEKGLEECKVN